MDNAKIYNKFNWEQLTIKDLKEKISKIIEFIPEDVVTILDVGCGNGVITNELGKKFNVTGVDRSDNALKYVQTKKIKSVSDNIPMNDGTFDMVFSSELLEHLEEFTFKKTIEEFKRLSRKYIFITVPNNENPDKIAIKCPQCSYTYNRPNHLKSFDLSDFKVLFPDYIIINSIEYGMKVRYYNRSILKVKKKLSPSSSWVPYYWIPEDNRNTICPKCENEFEYQYKFNPIATIMDVLNASISPKKPYWLFVLLEKNN